MGLVHHPNVVTDGIKFYWDAANRRSSPGTGSDGTAWTDLIKGKIGTLDNNATFTTHKGGYVEFDGTDDSVEIPNDADFTMPAGDWTICLWCADLGGNTDKRHIIGTYATNPRWIIRDTDDGAAGWAFMTKSDSAGWNRTYSTVDIQDTDDEWHYLVVTGSSGGGSGSIKLYTDGVDTSLSSSYALESITRATTTITMGLTATNGHDFMGYIASVAIYNRVLTAAEVLQNYEATRSRFAPRITKSGMLANWDAGDPKSYNGGTTWKDTANHYDGTLENDDDGSLTFDSANGGSLDFDGTDDYLNTNDTGFTSANGITGMVWVNLAKASTNVFFWKNHVFQFRYDSSQRLNFRSGGGSGWSTSADLTSAADLLTIDGSAWACVAASANKSNNAREMWLNGERVANDTGSGMGWGTNTVTLEVGGYTSHDWWTGGKIAMATLYERALSAAEIKDFYNKTKARFGH